MTSFEVGHELAEIGVVPRRCQVLAQPLPLARELVRMLELLQASTDVRRLAVVVVDSRIGHARLSLLIGAQEIRDELFEIGGHGRA